VPVDEARIAALSMFAGQVPCFFQVADPSCEENAKWMVYFDHEEHAGDCTYDMVWPVCAGHLGIVRRMMSPFWQVWSQAEALKCERCTVPVRMNRFEAL
jgi:hypothetical protein